MLEVNVVVSSILFYNLSGCGSVPYMGLDIMVLCSPCTGNGSGDAGLPSCHCRLCSQDAFPEDMAPEMAVFL